MARQTSHGSLFPLTLYQQVAPGAVTALWVAAATDLGAGPLTYAPSPQHLLTTLFSPRPERGPAAAAAAARAREVVVGWAMDQVRARSFVHSLRLSLCVQACKSNE